MLEPNLITVSILSVFWRSLPLTSYIIDQLDQNTILREQVKEKRANAMFLNQFKDVAYSTFLAKDPWMQRFKITINATMPNSPLSGIHKIHSKNSFEYKRFVLSLA